MKKFTFTFQLPTKGKFSSVSLFARDARDAIDNFREIVGPTTVFVLKQDVAPQQG